jgi:hypothetical protein
VRPRKLRRNASAAARPSPIAAAVPPVAYTSVVVSELQNPGEVNTSTKLSTV